MRLPVCLQRLLPVDARYPCGGKNRRAQVFGGRCYHRYPSTPAACGNGAHQYRRRVCRGAAGNINTYFGQAANQLAQDTALTFHTLLPEPGAFGSPLYWRQPFRGFLTAPSGTLKRPCLCPLLSAHRLPAVKFNGVFDYRLPAVFAHILHNGPGFGLLFWRSAPRNAFVINNPASLPLPA